MSGQVLISQGFERMELAKYPSVFIHCRPCAVAELFQSVTRPRLCLVLRWFALQVANHFCANRNLKCTFLCRLEILYRAP